MSSLATTAPARGTHLSNDAAITRTGHWFVLASPLFVLGFARLGVELSTRVAPAHLAWIPSFLFYYAGMATVSAFASRTLGLRIGRRFSFSLRQRLTIPQWAFGVILPAALPLPVFLAFAGDVPAPFFAYILVFSLVNPVFEEGYWRGFLGLVGTGGWGRGGMILYSALLFSASHWVLWGFWFRWPEVLGPTLGSAFLMGIGWMWLARSSRNLAYPILSHALVDVFNLSVAVYVGIVPTL